VVVPAGSFCSSVKKIQDEIKFLLSQV